MPRTQLKHITANSYYANLLKEVYAGNDSETMMVMQFLYDSYTLSSFDNDFVEQFYLIAQDDIEHHKLLGECIVKLGGDPVYCSSNNLFFNGKNIENDRGIKQMITRGIEIKEKSIINYKILIAKIIEKEIKNILEIILVDEQKHNEMLKNMLKKYENNI